MSDEIAHAEREAVEAEAGELDTGGAEAARDARDEELDPEAPEADVAEQRTAVLRHEGEPITERPADPDAEADPADVAEQRRVVEQDEEDYR